MITSQKTVCVVVPIYTTALAPYEWMSLHRCVSMLSAHPIVIVKPYELNIDALLDKYPTLLTENFADEYFAGVKSYNRMLLADEFYARFAEYEFMLICQLDAFVFSDQLLQWCACNYDYIGAPWLPPGPIPNRLGLAWIAAKRKCYRWFDRYVDCGDHTRDPQFTYSTGNGGFSLRRITAMREVLQRLDRRAERHRAANIKAWPEDQFFSVAANRYRQHLHIPEATEAAYFSWETNPNVGAKLTHGQLPFGCHAWNKLHVEQWRPIFAQLGYSLDELLKTAF